MTYHTFDASVLKEKTKFELSLDIEKFYPVKNADGTNPSMRVSVEADSLQAALLTLQQFSEDEGSAFVQLLLQLIGVKLGLGDDASIEEITNHAETISIFESTEQGFFELPIDVDLDFETGPKQNVNMIITTPSYAVAYQGMLALTTPQRLNGLMASFMPEDEDY